jgi:hypothetical protein
MPQHIRIAHKKKPSGAERMEFCTKKAARRSGGLPFHGNPLLAIHTAVLTTLSALLAALAGLLLTTLMLLTGLALSALLLLAGLALPALLRIALLVLRVARVLLFVRHFDVLHTGFGSPLSRPKNNAEAMVRFLPEAA